MDSGMAPRAKKMCLSTRKETQDFKYQSFSSRDLRENYLDTSVCVYQKFNMRQARSNFSDTAGNSANITTIFLISAEMCFHCR